MADDWDDAPRKDEPDSSEAVGWDDPPAKKDGKKGDGDGWVDSTPDTVEPTKEDMGPDVQLANAFFEGDDLRTRNPAQALEKFALVVSLAEKHAKELDLTDEVKSNIFKSMVHMTTLYHDLKQNEKMVAQYQKVLDKIPSVTRNEASDAIDQVLNACAETADTKLQEQLYNITSAVLAKMPDTDRMLFDVRMKLCKTLMTKQKWEEAQDTLDMLHKSCLTASGEDDKKGHGG